MKKNFSSHKRSSLKRLGQTALASAAWLCLPSYARSAAAHVVVVGGGFGGATAARYIKTLSPTTKVTLVEPKKRYYTCPFSNLYLGGLRTFEQQGHDFTDLSLHGIHLLHDYAIDVDTDKKNVQLANNPSVPYDKLVLAPGIDFRWNELSGYDEAAAELAPHAWNSGSQTALLKKQLLAMPDGGVFTLVVPENPFRCPPGPYERASMVAHYLQQHKPKSKLLILDAKDAFSKQALFQQAWATHYGSLIEWVPWSADGKVVRVDAPQLQVETEFGEIHQADVLNVIPPQKAGAIAFKAGVTDQSGWVPIKAHSFESKLVPDIYVVGDATIASPMPKSGFAANSQAKLAAAAIVQTLSGKSSPKALLANTCYSLIAPDYGISVAHQYGLVQDQLAELSGGTSPIDADHTLRQLEAQYGQAWYAAISQDIWGTMTTT